MKYVITEYNERYYVGLKRQCNLKKLEDMCIGELWTTFTSKNHEIPFIEGEMIGLEQYPKEFEQTRQFNYFALGPVANKMEIDGFVSVTLPKGKYVRVEITLQELFDGVTPKVYEFIQTTDLDIDYGIDYEEYPIDMNMNDTSSKMYIALKLK